ncbi:outer membrane protein [Phreatobacter stygius]|uniref:Porin family protein n=1 Tax=Phreatobacter stygius TaxID=1940610 RepID=A0A4D7AV35_9HYPH|nr:outer membrane protein [Phreatobacter stygius]QCI63455.1 porin family protein [Phreatobacter stygius]
MKKLIIAAAAMAGLASGAQAADLGVQRVAVPAAILAPAFNWTGFYVGLNAGIGIANTNLGTLTGGALSGSGTGFVGGAQIGYNYQINNFVLGVEGDFGYFGVRRNFNSALGFGIISAYWKTSWDASIRARAGIAIDRLLLYVTGGVAFADFGAGVTLGGAAVVVNSASQTRVGWTVGGGAEYAFTPNWTVRGEYLYSNYGNKDIFVGGANVRLETHKFRLGVNYLFSTGPGAIVARY